jgi:GT2 family glycosyltransferase
MSYIPKIIHQLWIGPKPAPVNFMNTWKEKHPDYEYIFWNEEEFIKRGIKFECQTKINDMVELNGKADIMRWELLYKYGGIFVDADSICIESFDNLLLLNKSFASYENEIVRGKGWGKLKEVLADTHPLVATGTMAFPPNHDLPKMAIEWIKNNNVKYKEGGKTAWITVGPGLLTRLYFSKKWDDMIILPSYYFLPIHYSGVEYRAHEKVYAYQEWGSTKNNYETMNNISLPQNLTKPDNTQSVSILVSSYNTKSKYIEDCLKSIKNQVGYFNIELVWINDGSDKLHTTLLKKLLDNFMNNTRFTTLIYHENEKNLGIGATLNKGILLCNNEIIIKMDSDDIMEYDRIATQYEFMMKNTDIHICGGQILMINENNETVNKTQHKSITWDEYKKQPSHWFINHPTVCYRKQSVINAGNYNKDLCLMAEDFELELRMLKKYKYIYNFDKNLLYYRLHSNQVTNSKGGKSPEYWNTIRNNIINNLINSD